MKKILTSWNASIVFSGASSAPPRWAIIMGFTFSFSLGNVPPSIGAARCPGRDGIWYHQSAPQQIINRKKKIGRPRYESKAKNNTTIE